MSYRLCLSSMLALVVGLSTPGLAATWVSWQGHEYTLVTSQLTWAAARDYAANVMKDDPGGLYAGHRTYLACVTSSEEDQFLASSFGTGPAWLGGWQDRTSPTYAEPGGGWGWVSSEPWSWTNWKSGEPNNSHSADEDFLAWDTTGWNDQWSRENYAYAIVEREAACDVPPTGVFVVDYIRHVIEEFDTNGGHVQTIQLEPERAYDAIFTHDGYYLIALSGTEGNGGAGLYDALNGEFVRWLVQNPTDNTFNLSSAAWGPDGTLFMTRNGQVEGNGTGGVITYDWNSGTTNLIISGLPGGTSGLSFSAGGHLFVAEPVADHVREYANSNGVWSNIRTLNVDYPAGTAIGADGHLYVARPYANAVLEYALAGNPLQWTLVRQLPCATLPGVVGLDFGPDGDLYIAVSYGDRIARFDFQTDTCSVFLQYAPFSEPANTVFRPILDCNDNCIPDEEDLANCTGSPWCGDCNTNGILDECDIANCRGEAWCSDFDRDGLLDMCDPDLDNDGVSNELDACNYTPAKAIEDGRVILDSESSLYGTIREDLDEDCDCDLADYQIFAQHMTGPNPNPYAPHPWAVP
jgi:hypothetical protein